MDSPNGLPKLKLVESAVFEVMGGGGGSAQPPPFTEGVGTKYFRTGRVNEKNLIHGRVTATISKFSPQIFERTLVTTAVHHEKSEQPSK